VLVTGAAGFIGSHLCERLVGDGHTVTGFDNFDPFYDPAFKQRNLAGLTGTAFTLVRGDLRDETTVAAAVAGHDAVVHLAAMAGVRASIERPVLYHDVNVRGTVVLLDAMQRAGVRRLCFASSSSVYGNRNTVPFRESDAVDHPISPYAATKKAGELLCHTWWHLHGFTVACLRLFTVYGPRQRPDLAIAKFIGLLRAGRPLPFFGDGSNSRDYTFVADTVDGIMRALAWTAQGPRYDVFNLGNSASVTLADLVAELERATGVAAALDRQPMQPGDVERTCADVAKSARELGYAPATPLSSGIARQVAWFDAVTCAPRPTG
jgi:UDP-glucuronate 4-epimerase